MTDGIVDLHLHVIPGVDDGARDLEEAIGALEVLSAEGVEIVVATPHFAAATLERPGATRRRLEELDGALAELEARVADTGLTVRIERGVELKLDAPEPDLSDPRLRLAGTDSVLVEFGGLRLPPYAGNQLRALLDAGWQPVLAHPERYAGMAERLERVGEWREAGVRFQLNAGSLLGQYGSRIQEAARLLFGRGWVDYLASDYHSRGDPALRAIEDALAEAEPGEELSRLLLATNPRRLLAGEPPLEVPPLALERAGRWKGFKGLLR